MVTKIGNGSKNFKGARFGVPALGTAVLGAGWFSSFQKPREEVKVENPYDNPEYQRIAEKTYASIASKPAPKKSGMRRYKLKEVQQHCTPKSLWVTFRGGVYDVTSFQNGHPGLKSRLLMAGGQDLSPFWEMYNDHYRGHVIPFLEKFKIGTLSDEDAKKAVEETKFFNAYDNDPVRHRDNLGCTYHPWNGECLLERLTEYYYTPNELHYTRNHLPVPDIDIDDYELTIYAGNGIKREVTLSFKDLTNEKLFKQYDVVSTLQCAGNRREDFHGTIGANGETNLIYIGPHWVVGAFSCAKWTGVRMRDVLAYAGLDVDSIALGKIGRPDSNDGIGQHIHLTGYDADETGLEYGVSIPVDKACDALGDCLIAFKMNGEPLPRDHGYPCRALVPGFAGARNCKWLQSISLEPNTSMKPWHENAYRGFSPNITFQNDLYLWENSPNVHLRNPTNESLQENTGEIALEQPVQSVVCNPPPESVIGGKGMEEIEVRGVAWSGGGNNVFRVDVSIDGGKSFVGAKLYKPKDLRKKEVRMRQWGWYHFSCMVPFSDEQKQTLRSGGSIKLDVCSKAVNGNFDVQPENIETYYNGRGIQINHFYHVPCTIDGNRKFGSIIRHDYEPNGDPKESFRNRPSGGHFRLPWETEEMKKNFVANASEKNYKENVWWDYDHSVLDKRPDWKSAEKLKPDDRRTSLYLQNDSRTKYGSVHERSRKGQL